MVTVELRRVPKQQRSREKYDRVLAVAGELIAERGNDGVSMREIADAASLPISTVYQYFPDKNAILWTLFSAHFDKLEQAWLSELEQITSYEALVESSLILFDAFVDLCRLEPTFSKLWRSIQANAVLAELDQALNQRIADALSNKLTQLGFEGDRDQTWTSVYLMASLSSSALQLAFDDEARCEAILEEFRDLIRVQMVRIGRSKDAQ